MLEMLDWDEEGEGRHLEPVEEYGGYTLLDIMRLKMLRKEIKDDLNLLIQQLRDGTFTLPQLKDYDSLLEEIRKDLEDVNDELLYIFVDDPTEFNDLMLYYSEFVERYSEVKRRLGSVDTARGRFRLLHLQTVQYRQEELIMEMMIRRGRPEL